ncbi:MAG: hypothetical protein M3Q08_02170 [Pseudomonadota bacterium]|nr:hypothetical protein [Pseudomonadota bacterium]
MFKPWTGSNFHETRLLILGESAYSWREEGELCHPSENHSIDLVETTIDELNSVPLMAKITRALAAEESPSKERRQFVWDRVAFTNFVQESVGEGAGTRPRKAMWREAAKSLVVLLNDLKPRRMIALGKTMYEYHLPEDGDIYLTDNVHAYQLNNGQVCLYTGIIHPSAPGWMGWKALADVIHFAVGDKLRPLP